MKIEYAGTAEEQARLQAMMQDAKRLLRYEIAQKGKYAKVAKNMLRAINEMEDADDYTITIGIGSAGGLGFGRTTDDGRTITIDWDKAGRYPGQAYLSFTLTHELGHAYSHVTHDPFIWGKSDFNAWQWGTTVRAAAGACEENINHLPVNLFPSASGSCQLGR